MNAKPTKIEITEINFIPVKPKDGLVGFVSFVFNRQFYFGNISIFTHLFPEKKVTYRLSYPEDPIRKKSFFHPINRKTQIEIEKAVSDHIDMIRSRAA
ncbi:septation protein SpoVG family protein [Candidatus Pacearchaeota archaeon]|nr:septation protein SpoVG family protein [Candidatus Pacearchaeota archaeon]